MIGRRHPTDGIAIFLKLSLFLLIALISCRSAVAGVRLLALTGDAQPGSSGPKLLSISSPTLNESGEVAFHATLMPGVGGVTPSNDEAVWRIDSSGSQLVAWAGAGSAPGAAKDPFASFQDPALEDSGSVVVAANLNSGRPGVWRLPAFGAGSMLAIAGATGVPGAGDASFELFLRPLFTAPAGATALNARLAIGAAGVSNANDQGLWLHHNGALSLVSREEVTAVPGVDGAKFRVQVASAISDQAEIAAIGTLIVGTEGVTSANAAGVWRLTADGGELIARRNAGAVPGVLNASFDALQNATINSTGRIAYSGQLALGGAVTTANNRGIWQHKEGVGELVVRSGVTVVPGVPAAAFDSFDAPLLNDAGEVLLAGSLVHGTGGVTPTTADGLWVFGDESAGRLLARSGSGGVPGVVAAEFDGFDALAFNAQGVAAVKASLLIGAGGISESNKLGLWLLGEGVSTLVARTGDVLAGRTIADLEFTAGSGGGDGRARGLNDNNQLAFKATFTNGEEGLFLYSPSGSADFTGDGAVDAADLQRWRTWFGASIGGSNADADGDGDSDGADFLVWQRQLGVIESSPSAVPEPSGGFIAALGVAALLVRRPLPSRRPGASLNACGFAS